MAQITATPYWLEASMPAFPKLDRSLDVDVVVIGAGITGLTTAYLVKRAGRSVAVLDRSKAGGYDTMATTAHVTCVTDLDLRELERKFGRDHAQAVWDAGTAAIDQIEAIVSDEDIDCEWSRVTGYKYAAPGSDSDRENDRLREEARLATELGFEAQFMDEVPLVRRAGVAFEAQARMHPRKYLARLALLIDGDGSFVFEDTACDEVQSEPLAVKSGSFKIRTQYVVLATHNPIVGKGNIASATILQTKIYLNTSYVVGGKLPRGVAPEALFWDTADPYHYIRIDKHADHDYVIFGGADHKTGQGDPKECFRRIEQEAAAMFPGLDVTHHWSGQVIETNDGLPYIGETSANQFAATGFAGNGTTFGTVASMMARDRVVGLNNPWSGLFDVGRTKIAGGAWDYVKENVDFPYYLVKGWVARPEGKSLRELKRGEGKVLEIAGDSVAAYRDEHGKVTMVSPVCTHMACIVGWNDAEKTWDCPCHGSRFSPKGKVLAGPAESPLPRVRPSTKKEQ